MPVVEDESSEQTSTSTNSTPFLLADIGEGISEVELLQWFVDTGDTVSQFDRVCEVQSDKANVEITSRFDGRVERLCGNVGDMMFVGKPLLYIATDNAPAVVETETERQPRDMKMSSQQQATTTLNNVDDERDRIDIPSAGTNNSIVADRTGSGSNEKVLTSPAVRKLSKENDIDLRTIVGTGPGGRISKADVLEIIGAKVGVHDAASNTAGARSPSPPSSTELATSNDTKPSSSSNDEDTVIPIRGYHRQMVKSMTSSLSVPHMVYADEVNVDALASIRDSLRPIALEVGIPKLTYMPFFIKAASLALNKYPALNSTIDSEQMTLTYHGMHNVGVAVDTQRGLALPVVRGCSDKSVLDIARELGRLYALAFEGNLSEADIADPTFTLSNIGAIGGTYMSPVVLPPQVGIGAIGKIQRLPRFTDNESDIVEAVRIMNVSWGGDHRAVDGATMARFGNLWKGYVENPSSMMFAMR